MLSVAILSGVMPSVCILSSVRLADAMLRVALLSGVAIKQIVVAPKLLGVGLLSLLCVINNCHCTEMISVCLLLSGMLGVSLLGVVVRTVVAPKLLVEVVSNVPQRGKGKENIN